MNNEAASRTVRGTGQNILAGAIVVLINYIFVRVSGDSFPAEVVLALEVIIAGIVTFVHNVAEGRLKQKVLAPPNN